MKPQEQAELVERYKAEITAMVRPDIAKHPDVTWVVEYAAEQLAWRDKQLADCRHMNSDLQGEVHNLNADLRVADLHRRD